LDDDEKDTLDQIEGGNINGLGTVGAMPTIISESGPKSCHVTPQYVVRLSRYMPSWLGASRFLSLEDQGFAFGQVKARSGGAILPQIAAPKFGGSSFTIKLGKNIANVAHNVIMALFAKISNFPTVYGLAIRANCIRRNARHVERMSDWTMMKRGSLLTTPLAGTIGA
jgi:hypothetical protein